MRSCIQINLLPYIIIHTHTQKMQANRQTCTHRKNTKYTLCFGTFLIISLKLFWTRCSLASYQVQSEIFLLVAPPPISRCTTVKISLGGTATSEGDRPLALARAEQCWHVQPCDRWTEWKKEQEEPRAIWRVSLKSQTPAIFIGPQSSQRPNKKRGCLVNLHRESVAFGEVFHIIQRHNAQWNITVLFH